MPIRDKKLATQPRTEPASTMLRSCKTSKTPTSPNASPTNCSRVTFSPMKWFGECRSRLQPRNQCRNAGGHALTDRGEHASKVTSMYQRACNETVADLIRIRPPRTGEERDCGHDDHDENHPHGQKSQRLDVRHARSGRR